MRIFKAIRARDPDSASWEAREHIAFVEKELREILSMEKKT